MKSSASNLRELKREVITKPHREYQILYFSASYCKPCVKIKNQIDSLESDRFDKIKLIEIEHKNFSDTFALAIWKKYKVRSVPTFIYINNDLSELNESGIRDWKKEDEYLDVFIKAIWPEKTPKEVLAEKRRDEMNKKRGILLASLRADPRFHKISKTLPFHNYLVDQKRKFEGEEPYIREFQDFIKLDQQYYKDIKKMFLRLEGMTSTEREQVLSKLNQFKEIKYLHIVYEDEIPEEIFELTSLVILKIGIGFGHDVLSEKIAQLKNLEHLSIGYGPIRLPKNIGEMFTLKSITIMGKSENQPEGLYELPNLEYLSLDYKHPDGGERLKNLKSLKFLRTNFFHPGINELYNLKSFVLIGSELGDISNMKSLEKIELYNTKNLEVGEELLAHESLMAVFIHEPMGEIVFKNIKPTNLRIKYFFISHRDELEIPGFIKEIKHFVYYEPY